MRKTRPTSRFKKDYKRELRGQHGKTLDRDFLAVATLLANDQPLPVSLRDHPMTGDLKDHRDCHIKPDLVLIYRFPDEASLEFVRLGSHSELGL
jgi:mRNA interferase YafQ